MAARRSLSYTAPMSGRQKLLCGYFTLCALALVWPGYALLGNDVLPYVLGLPRSFAWNLGWVVLTFIVMGSYHLSGGEEG
jgi:hypothetical protein